ncbi:FecR family protein [Tenacibaculum sp. MEBiC06402]|uniref:FecR family protein n=1 Tax=unclassified Tenacibaculum TaxID=2635139 RepID=UPI003B9A041D
MSISMEKAELIKKWLDNNLNPEEQKQFEALEDYNELIQLSDKLKQFKAPDYKSDGVLEDILAANKVKKEKLISFNFISKIAAIFIIGLSLLYFFRDNNTNINALAANKVTTKLPDNSEVTINALSSISFNGKTWKDKREVSLKGEAFFKVAKGSKFNVHTNNGTVTVLGTEFNVKNRDNDFEVICYEGSVLVESNNISETLTPGDSFKSGKIFRNNISVSSPSWIHNESVFTSEPFNKVLQEFERQYDVKVKVENMDTSLLFTGKFIHNDIETALKTLTLPFNLVSEQKNKTIILKSERTK